MFLETKYKIVEIKVQYNRLDCIISEVSKNSRNKMAQRIENKEVFVNHIETTNRTMSLREKDIFSIRGIGKFKINRELGYSKKGNLIFEICKY